MLGEKTNFACERFFLFFRLGSENEEKQIENREKVLRLADFIVPGHGAMFKVPKSK